MTERKLKDSRGETLVELLAAILIAALSVAVLFTCCMASAEMGRETRDADREYYELLSQAEKQQGDAADTAKVTVARDGGGTATETELPVNLYGGKDLYSYKKGAP